MRFVFDRLQAASSSWGKVVVVLLVLAWGAVPALAQQEEIPRLPRAELSFEEGVAAFESGRLAQAAGSFEAVTEFPLNRKTTAAFLMAAKARYRMGQYEDAQQLLDTLLRRYPETSYRDEADRLLQAVEDGLSAYGQRPDTLRIGIVLPTRDRDADLTQSLFNGVRLAVDEHNGVRRRYVLPPKLQRARVDSFEVFDTAEMFGDSLAAADGATTIITARDTIQVDSLRIVTEQVGRPSYVAKMYFRAAGERSERAGTAVDSLVRLDRVDVVLGPLYSSSARAAGRVAESDRVLMIAPLATDVSVAEGRRFVFQANPTIPMRGRRMARFAAENLLLKSGGIIYEKSDATARQMADGFKEEARQIGVQVPFTLELNSRRDWSRLPEAFAADSTVTDSMRAEAEAVYLPIAGRDAQGKIQDALVGLQRFATPLRVLGNSQWHDLPVKTDASSVRATYANDFHVNTARPEVQAFIRRHRLLTGETPDALSVTGQRLAYTGYDVARFLLQTLRPSRTRPGPDALRSAPRYDGLGIRIDFSSGNVNRAMYLHRYLDGQLELLN